VPGTGERDGQGAADATAADDENMHEHNVAPARIVGNIA
jgi:hypothetical protein